MRCVPPNDRACNDSERPCENAPLARLIPLAHALAIASQTMRLDRRKTARRIRRLGQLLATALLLLLTLPPAAAQTERSTYYWRYPASLRLDHILPADVNVDGVDELIIVTENGDIDLLTANGLSLWKYAAGESVLAVTTANVDASPAREIVVAMRNRMAALTAEGDLIWETAVTLVEPPPALFLESGVDGADAWQDQYDAIPAAVSPFDRDQDGLDEIALLLQSGQLQLFDGFGNLVWRYARNSTPGANAQPHLAVGDLNEDGRQELVLAFFRRFSQMTLLDGNGESLWEQPIGISGRTTALELVDFPGIPGLGIAVGTDRGDINLYNSQRERLWPRTLNRPITALTVAYRQDEPILVAGTSVGTVVAFSAAGRRLWNRQLVEDANRPVINLSAVPLASDEQQPLLSVILGSSANAAEPSDVLLLGNNGRTLTTLPAVDTTGLTRLTDINRDGKSELLLARFATVELQGIGLGASEPTNEWNYSLRDSAPSALLVVDIDLDGDDEVLVGAQNGRLHCLKNDRRLCWLTAPGEPVTDLAALNTLPGVPPSIIVVRNRTTVSPEAETAVTGWLELRQADSERLVWEKELTTEISSLVVANINQRGQPEIVIGTRDGALTAYTTAGTVLWQQTLIPPSESMEAAVSAGQFRIQDLILQENTDTETLNLLAVTPRSVFTVAGDESFFPQPIIHHEAGIQAVYPIDQPGGELATRLIVFTEDGQMHGHHYGGIELPQWPLPLEGAPLVTLPANEIITEAFQQTSAEAFLVATDQGDLRRISIDDNDAVTVWQWPGPEDVTSLYWGDLDGDSLPDVAVGSEDDVVQLFGNVSQAPILSNELALSSGVFAIQVLARENAQDDLLVVTENGEVELFRAQENRPPLLTDPQFEVRPGQVSFSVSVTDAEQDETAVTLQIQNPAAPTGWDSMGARTTNSNERLFWPAVDVPSGQSLVYRYVYDDGSFDGAFTPPAIPPLPRLSPLRNASPLTLIILLLGGVGTAVLLLRQWQTPALRARRFYRSLQQQPAQILTLLEERYLQSKGSPDFLLYLASEARQHSDGLVTNLADGLYLLAERPRAGLPILNSTLKEAAAAKRYEPLHDISRWQRLMHTSQMLLEAPSITELSLLRPLLVQLLTDLEKMGRWSPLIDMLLPILSNLRDSERVNQAEDQMVYLNEAAVRVDELQNSLPEYTTRIEKTLVRALLHRWTGLISAELEDLRGRAELVIALKTRRIIPAPDTELVIELQNNGRAAAENVIVELQAGPAYGVSTPPQVIPFLPPGRTREVSIGITLRDEQRFRVSLAVSYDDRSQRDKTVAFADMVHVLQPMREYKHIANPYLPGTPLRPHSTVFYGRERLFSFISENAGGQSQHNVLILIGQRRTGKTSALLRLGERLPDYLLPVYVDCQSLGVVPGMPAFFNDLAWLIADALSMRDIELDVPEMATWEADPTGVFQRQFLPTVRALLTDSVKLLLVFDEFEAFESLVNDGILPRTFFTFMRHLMQHSNGLGFVFVGTRRLEAMSADYWSVLFNIALYDHIRYLDEASAVQLIKEPVAPNLLYDDLAIDKILRVTAGHPYFLQLVCYTLVKRANAAKNNYVTVSDVNAGLDEMLSLGEVHFAYLWQRSSFAEQALLTAVAHLMDQDVSFHPADLINYLADYGIHLDPTEVTQALTNLVEREIMREVKRGATTLYELHIGLVGLWIAKHKSLSKLHAAHPEAKRPLPSVGAVSRGP